MTLCSHIDTLSMAYLDDELAAEERHELETHLTECASCKSHVDAERVEHSVLRKALAAPPAPDIVRARIAKAIDLEDRAGRRRRWAQWALPGSAIVAAAAAILVFVGVNVQPNRVGSVAQDAVRQQTRTLPMEVQGTSTAAWLRQNFEPNLEPPRFEPGSQIVGGRLLPHGVNGHDAALVSYQVNLNGNPFLLSMLVVRELRGDEMTEGSEVKVDGRTLHVVEENGRSVVTYVDGHHMGYLFMAPELSVNELVWLVSQNLGGLPQ